MEIIFATGNAHKAMEAQSILGETFTVIMPKELGITDDIPENCDTLLGNAVEKCTYLWKICKRACFADDTGLEVDVLGGAPGGHTARYAGDDQNFDKYLDKLLGELSRKEMEASLMRSAGIAPKKDLRRARFKSVITLIIDGQRHFFNGVLEGRIARKKAGRGGFGYDPIFIADDYPEVTLAEVTEEQKNAVSHRGKALRAMAEFLKTRTEPAVAEA